MTHAISSNTTEPLPGDFARSVLVFAELIMFGALSSVYAFARSSRVTLFDATQHTQPYLRIREHPDPSDQP